MKLKFFAIAILLGGLIYLSKPATAKAAYPVPELGNCRDSTECKLYCDIPANTPACWSYGKYVMSNQARLDSTRQVLGDTAVNITYPIAALGNCADAQACFLYCAQPKNQDACQSFAQSQGLVKDDEMDGDANDSSISATKKQEILAAAKTELGCDNKSACMALCNNPTNADRCHAFAKNHGLEKEHGGPSQEIMEKAKSQLGCDSANSCSNFCQKDENHEKCFAFAKENNLMSQKEQKKIEKMQEARKKMLEAAKDALGCDSQDSCYQFCKDPQNLEKCMSLAGKVGMTPPSGMSGRPNTNASNTALTNPTSRGKPGDFLGPSGCKTEEECRNFCQNHPDQCPGFPKATGAGTTGFPSQSPQISPAAFMNSQLPSTQQPQQFQQQQFQPPQQFTSPQTQGGSNPTSFPVNTGGFTAPPPQTP